MKTEIDSIKKSIIKEITESIKSNIYFDLINFTKNNLYANLNEKDSIEFAWLFCFDFIECANDETLKIIFRKSDILFKGNQSILGFKFNELASKYTVSEFSEFLTQFPIDEKVLCDFVYDSVNDGFMPFSSGEKNLDESMCEYMEKTNIFIKKIQDKNLIKQNSIYFILDNIKNLENNITQRLFKSMVEYFSILKSHNIFDTNQWKENNLETLFDLGIISKTFSL